VKPLASNGRGMYIHIGCAAGDFEGLDEAWIFWLFNYYGDFVGNKDGELQERIESKFHLLLGNSILNIIDKTCNT
jgi:hypothetical protein